MKKLLSLLTLSGMLFFGANNVAFAQEPTDTNVAEQPAPAPAPEAEKPANADDNNGGKAEDTKDVSFHQTIKQQFIEGDPKWMAPVLICLILGLALCIERILYLNLATTNVEKLVQKVEAALASGGVNAAKEVCRNTRGPVASIFYQALDRSGEGIDMAEKAVVNYGSVQNNLLEKGLSWIALFIALAPMLGFLGTVIGMIQAFADIEKAKSLAPDVVAGGMKVALLTTVGGLIVAMILQIFYNYILSKIDTLVNDMENGSIEVMDAMIKHKVFEK